MRLSWCSVQKDTLSELSHICTNDYWCIKECWCTKDYWCIKECWCTKDCKSHPTATDSAQCRHSSRLGTGNYDHITPALRDVLHWLPVPQRTEFKIAVLAFDRVCGAGPAYFKDVCVPVLDIAARSSLHLAECSDFFVPRKRTTKLSRRKWLLRSSGIHYRLTYNHH